MVRDLEGMYTAKQMEQLVLSKQFFASVVEASKQEKVDGKSERAQTAGPSQRDGSADSRDEV